MRKLVVLVEAIQDIEQARDFYDDKASGIGDYCADSLIADIILKVSRSIAESIPANLAFTRCSLTGFLLASAIGRREPKHRLSRCWTCAATRTGFAKNSLGAGCRPSGH